MTPTLTTDLATRRADYARRMLADIPGHDPRLEQAFAAVPRERFLGAPPWRLVTATGTRIQTETRDPADLYDDVLIELDQARGVNNGSPSLHALMLHHLGVRLGDRILHAGTGGGYFTAILAELAGPAGHVTGIEVDAPLAAAAATHLAAIQNVTVIHGDSADHPAGDIDRIYVNFGVAAPLERWLDRLTDGGTLVLPLCVPHGHHGSGAVLALTRHGCAYAVRFVSRCRFVMAEGPLAGDAALRERLAAAFERDGVEFVRSLRRHQPSPERCWFWTPDWCLSFDDITRRAAPPAPRIRQH